MEDAELAAKLGEAFRLYSYQILNGNIGPFKKFLTESSGNFTITFNGDKIRIIPITELETVKETKPYEPKIVQEIITHQNQTEDEPKIASRRRKTS